MTDPEYARRYAELQAAIRAGDTDPDEIAALVEALHTAYLAEPRASTPGGLPYPLPTDPLGEGADAIRALAEALYGPWTTPSTGTDWSSPSGRGPARFRIRNGMVELAGSLWKSSAISTTGEICAFSTSWPPYGYTANNPMHLQPGSAVATAASTSSTRVRFWVNSGGNLMVRADDDTARIIYLDGLSWRVS